MALFRQAQTLKNKLARWATHAHAAKFSAIVPSNNTPAPPNDRSTAVNNSNSSCSCCANGIHKPNRLQSTSSIADDRDIAGLLANNKKWVEEMREEDPDFFTQLGKGQSPRYLYVGCSDSRVPVNQILGLRPGEVFVHRNVGNLVVNSDLNVLSVLEYAVDHLNVEHIMVTGHYDCGAVKAAVQMQDLGLVENWLRNIRDVHRLHHEEIDAIDDSWQRHRRLVELNVMEQCLNVFKTGVVQRKRAQTYSEKGFAYPRVHALVFDPGEGILHKLPVNFNKEIAEFRHVYDLYNV